MGEVWKRELRVRGGYSARPRNVLWPLVVGLSVYARRFDRSWTGSDDSGVSLLADRREGRPTESVQQTRANVTLRTNSGHEVRTYTVGVVYPTRSAIPGAMRLCLRGTGYRMDTRWERALARWAHRRGLRRDRVFGPDDERRWELRRRGLWLGEGR